MDLQPAILATLVLVAIGLAWLIVEARKLNDGLAPLLNSSVGRALASV